MAEKFIVLNGAAFPASAKVRYVLMAGKQVQVTVNIEGGSANSPNISFLIDGKFEDVIKELITKGVLLDTEPSSTTMTPASSVEKADESEEKPAPKKRTRKKKVDEPVEKTEAVPETPAAETTPVESEQAVEQAPTEKSPNDEPAEESPQVAEAAESTAKAEATAKENVGLTLEELRAKANQGLQKIAKAHSVKYAQGLLGGIANGKSRLGEFTEGEIQDLLIIIEQALAQAE